jgi:hypothetical protein
MVGGRGQGGDKVSHFLSRLPAVACLIGLSAVVLSGCAGPDGGYAYGGDPGVDYYEPYGFAYGGWGHDYHVAPYHGSGHGFAGGGFHGAHAFRSAPAGHAMPSLPAGRGGGFAHGAGGPGGGHAGGGGGRR